MTMRRALLTSPVTLWILLALAAASGLALG